jgi:hypothetical protein
MLRLITIHNLGYCIRSIRRLSEFGHQASLLKAPQLVTKSRRERSEHVCICKENHSYYIVY